MRKECKLFRGRIFLLSNRIDNEMSMFQLILKFGESVKLEDFAVDYAFNNITCLIQILIILYIV